MHIIAHAVPRDDRARTVRAEHAVRRVVEVVRGGVAALSNDLLRIVAGIIARDAAGDAPAAAGIGRDLGGVIAHRGHRRAAGEHGHIAVRLGRGKRAGHEPHIADRAADLLGRDLDAKGVVRLEQDAFGLHEPLPHGAPRRLAEVAALRMLNVRPACRKGDFHIRYR